MSKQHEESATAEIATEEADKQVAALQSVVDKTVRVVSAQWALVDKENELENFPEVHNVMLELGYKNETSVILPGPGSMRWLFSHTCVQWLCVSAPCVLCRAEIVSSVDACMH